MPKIHPTAIIGGKAVLGDVDVGPYAIIEDGAAIGDGTSILAHAYVAGGTTIGKDCEIHMGAVVGHIPQHLKYKGARTYLKIGDRNIIREYCSIHRGFEEGSATAIGDGNLFMGLSHIAHDSRIGNNIVVCNGALVAGHVTVEDGAFVSGNVTIHQFVKIGTLAMIGGLARVNKDVVPYTLIEGDSEACSLNIVGIKRSGISAEAAAQIKRIYRLIYRSGLNVSQALAETAKLGALAPEAEKMVSFIKSSERGICKHRRPASSEEDI
ncbi:MAG TPA: acyl-ACP--UDP-N-acetylglucosamine O-acyltransferase [Candidatus Omnitrophota bacterium]|nr:acyl-ACP--UDP-N-acetylglucosamine O-acyltransferase [Candidatus Omnitrophota bacterium]HPN65869.1 acyl-ACP--UDP-N-acetylglucosamine O-acyltransferase [Candidatus Omnitrophota bacterium]HRZ67871.1 acyl-ACP--UDP-N-acetylglucosamine O-acyltransferase [Candidatus Omnitrophota bacterium]